MGNAIRFVWIVAFVLGCIFPDSSKSQVSVTTYHNDNARTGQNTQETVLTPLNVNSTQFGKLFTAAVDGYVYAQPLYLANVAIQGGIHNVLYIATEHDSLYAIDADAGAIYWRINLIAPGGSTASSGTDFKCGDLVPESGITGTPVIDSNTGTLYVVATSVVNGTVVQYLHAIDVISSAEKFGGPVMIQATAPGTAGDGNGTTVSFRALYENQRAALLLDGGHVVIGWSSHCDIDPWHGWIMSYGAASLSQEGVLNTSANGASGGVWMSGGGMAADANGNIFVPTGNGSWNGTTDFGDSLLKLGPPNGGSFPVLDYFTPYNQDALRIADLDIASGGLVLLPPPASGGQLLAQMGKEGTIYLLDQNNLGKNCTALKPACSGSDPQIVQEIPKASVGVWGSPAYWNGSIYWGGASADTGASDSLKAFSFDAGGSGLISTAPTSKSAHLFAYSAPVPSISANGSASGIVWGLDNSTYGNTCNAGQKCQVLYAYDATNLANMLYNSSQAANNRDVPGSAVKFATPTIANGKVYVGSQASVSAYGELGTFVATAPSPTFMPASGTYGSPQTISLSDSLSTAAIYFTTDGTTPTTGSAVYGGPFQIAQTTTIRAIAVAGGYINSAISTATYTLSSSPPPATPIDVDLSAYSNVYAIFNNGTPVTNGGMDTYGYAYSENLLGTSLTWSGVKFNFGGAGVPSAVDGAVLALPAGNYSTIKLLGAAVQGNHVNQVFMVTYSDGTRDSFTQSMSDWAAPQNYPGESKALTTPYRVRTQGTLNGSVYVYGYSFAVKSAKTVVSIALPKNRDIVVLAVALCPAGGGPPPPPPPPPPGDPVPVDLSAAFNVYAIFNNGTPVTNGGMDTYGYAYSENLLGTSLTWSAVKFTFGGADVPSAVDGAVLALPAGNYSAIKLLGVAVQGSHVNQVFIVTYTDGTKDSFTQSMSDWAAPQTYPGESKAMTMPYRVRVQGTLNGSVYVYGYSFAINSAKSVASVALPKNRDIVLLAVTLVP